MLTSIRNIKVIKCIFLICLSPLFVLYFSKYKYFLMRKHIKTYEKELQIKMFVGLLPRVQISYI